VRVLDSAGKPIERATIETHDAGGHDVEFAEIQRTKADGTYEAVGVKPGRWSIRASAANFQSASREVDVAAGERPVVEIRLLRAGEQH
jgi:protocatechuate 3,4-dioxygenase beta subunit